jgi:hypothetical protein
VVDKIMPAKKDDPKDETENHVQDLAIPLLKGAFTKFLSDRIMKALQCTGELDDHVKLENRLI